MTKPEGAGAPIRARTCLEGHQRISLRNCILELVALAGTLAMHQTLAM